MKQIFIVFTIIFLSVNQSFAQEERTLSGTVPYPIEWSRYLSDVEKMELVKDLAIKEVERMEKTGELYV